MDLSRDGFLSRGFTIACLKEVGKRPSLKERMASCEISSAKTPGQALMRIYVIMI